MRHPRPLPLAPKHAFSLIEVTMALGIIVFAMVALLGLLPVGLKTFDGAVDSTIATQISQGILTSAMQAKFSELGKFQQDSPYYFDSEGQVATAADHIYRADVALPVDLDIPKKIGTQANPNTKRIAVTVTRISDPQSPKNYRAWIADNGL